MKEEEGCSKTKRSPSQVEAEEDGLPLRGVRGSLRLLLLLALLLSGIALSLLLGARLFARARPPARRQPIAATALAPGPARHTSTTAAATTTAAASTHRPQAPAAAVIAAASTDGVAVISTYTTDLSSELRPGTEEQLCSVYGSSAEVCVIVCKGITTAPPGVVASLFLAKEGASQCGHTPIHVVFIYCQFPGRRLERGWFPVRNETLRKLIQTLSIENAFIDYIGDDAFAGLRGLTRLEINGGEVQELRTAIFRSPTLEIIDRDNSKPFLKQLNLIRQERLQSVENGLLEGIASLESFQMLGTPNIETLLPNITTAEKSNVEILDLRYNVHLNTLRPSYFTNMTKVQSLYFTKSDIFVIEPGTFQNMNMLSLLHLDFTQLTTLAEGIIPDRLFRNQNTVYLGNNSWHCTCEIAWLARKMNSSVSHFGGYLPECYTPRKLRGKLVNRVDFSHCDATSSTTNSNTQKTTTPTGTTKVEESTSEGSPTSPPTTSSFDPSQSTDSTTISTTPFQTSSTTATQTMKPTSPSTTTVKEPTTTIKTTIHSENNSSPLASTPQVSSTATSPTTIPPFLLPQNVSDCKESKYNVIIYGSHHKHDKRGIGYMNPILEPEGNNSNYPPTNPDFVVFETNSELFVDVGNGTEVSDKKWTLVWIDEENHCYIHLQAQSQLMIRGLGAGGTYTVCLLFGDTFAASPFNCRAVTMSLPYENRAWIVNAEKPYVIGLFSGIAIVIALLFMAVMYALISRFPELLKRNKRVVIVNYQNTKALILPGGYKPKSSPKVNAKRDRKLLSPDSTTSNTTATTRTTSPRSSTTTYVSVNEPSEEELVIWRLHKMIDTLAAKEEKKMKKREESKASNEGREEPPSPPDRIASISWRLEPPDSAHGSSV